MNIDSQTIRPMGLMGSIRYLAVLWLFLVMAGAPGLASAQEVYWANPATLEKLDTLAVENGNSATLRVVSDVPQGEMLNAFQFRLTYDPSRIEIDNVVAVSDDVAAINYRGTPGVIIFNGFTVAGISSTVSLVDVSFTAVSTGAFNFLITIETFSSNTGTIDPQPTPRPITVTIPAGVTARIFWSDTGNQEITDIDLDRAGGENDQRTVRLRAEVPTGVTLQSYQFTLNYGTGITVENIVASPQPPPPAAFFPPVAINPGVFPDDSGQIIFNSFDLTGVTGPATLSLVDITVRGKDLFNELNAIPVVDNYDATGGVSIPTQTSNLSISVGAPRIAVTVGENGRVTYDGGEIVGPATQNLSVTPGQEITFTLVPDAGFEIDTVQQDGEPVILEGDTVTFENVTADRTLDVTFRATAAPPVAEFEGTPLSGSAPLTVAFTDLSTGDGISAWSWDFGDPASGEDNTSTDQNPTHTYTAPGVYSVTLTVTGTGGESAPLTKTDYITVTGDVTAPTADFTADPTSGNAPLTVQFTDTSTGEGITAWTWDFGDPDSGADNMSTVQNPLHIYATPGFYTVTLTVTNAAGTDEEVKTDFITVSDATGAPVANFTADITNGLAPLTVTFTDTSIGEGITAWSWDFGDPASGANNTSTAQNPSHQYASPGTYTVALTVTNEFGSDTETKTAFITVTGQPGGLPDAAFTASVTEGDVPLTVQFTDQSTGDGIVAWEWDFGDGSPASTERNPTHEYTVAGVYAVSLKVTNALGASRLKIQNFITVTDPSLEPPEAEFEADRTSGDAPLTVQFTDLSTGDAEIVGWEWDFGDGSAISTEQNPEHTYAAPGTYDVSLTAFSAGGKSTLVKQAYITVTDPMIVPPDADFTATPTQGDAPLTVQFTDQSTGDGLSQWAWDFGDGGDPLVGDTEVVRNPSYVYQAPGTYTVSLTVTGAGGVSTETKENLIVVRDPNLPPPQADFTASPTGGNRPLTVQFTDASTGTGISQWEWDFGDGSDPLIGSTENFQNPTHVYSGTGRFTVSLKIFGDGGTDTETKTDFITVTSPPTPPQPPPVLELPEARFEADVTRGEAPLTVEFTDRSTGSGLFRWEWDFGDGSPKIVGSTSADRNPEHTYINPGQYTVILKVWGSAGTDVEVKTNYITVTQPEPPAVNPDASFTFEITGDDKLTVNFTDTSTPQEAIVRRVWDFGDGSDLVDTAQPTVSHAFTTMGVYFVTLTVYTAQDRNDTTTELLTVGQGTINADFSAVPLSGFAPLGVQFTDASVATSGITQWQWRFGDGTTGAARNPVHTYTNAGTYTVELTVSGPDGTETAVKSNFIRVMTQVEPEEGVDPPVPVAPGNGATDVGLMVEMQVAPYADPNNVFAFTVWEIATDPSFTESTVAWRATNTATALPVPNFVLTDGRTAYWWRAQFVDVNGLESPWSQAFQLVTVQNAPEDANGDGVPDNREADPSLFPVPKPETITKYVVAANGVGAFGVEADNRRIADIVFLEPFGAAESGAPDTVNMPSDVIGFKLDLNRVGEIVQVRVRLSQPASDLARWYIVDENGAWIDYTVYSAFSEDRRTVAMVLEDGGVGDWDRIRNGVIIVPASGFGVLKVLEPPTEPETPQQTGGAGEEGGCFIDRAARSWGTRF